MGLPATNEPGELFVYGPANMEVFGALLEKKLARRGLSPLRYLEKRVLEPLGAGYSSWQRDKMGHPMMSSGATMTARQLLALGRLLLKRGVWNGRRLVAVNALSQLFQGSEANPAYGMTFWLNANVTRADATEVDIEKTLALGRPYEAWGSACISKVAPADLVAMVGSWNQRIYVSPSLDLVVVRQGNGTDFSDAEFLSKLLKQD
jgi:CubicO group peptidase (beta-lactamase class C family)